MHTHKLHAQQSMKTYANMPSALEDQWDSHHGQGHPDTSDHGHDQCAKCGSVMCVIRERRQLCLCGFVGICTRLTFGKWAKHVETWLHQDSCSCSCAHAMCATSDLRTRACVSACVMCFVFLCSEFIFDLINSVIFLLTNK